MRPGSLLRRLAALALCALLAACAAPQPSATIFNPAAPESHGRSMVQVQEVFDRNAEPFYRIYNRRAHDNSAIGAGRLLVSFGVAPDGSVSHCELIASTFNDPELEQQILKRIAALNFGVQDVPQFEVARYPIDFRPM
jgi:hypothetical protein